jgi:hypothetical protein
MAIPLDKINSSKALFKTKFYSAAKTLPDSEIWFYIFDKRLFDNAVCGKRFDISEQEF